MSANLRQSQAHGQAPTVDARIAAIASRQRDLITIAQLLAVGLTDGAITRRVARGALRRVHRGVYTTSHAPLSPEAKALAAAHRMFVDLADALTPHQLANVIHAAAYRGRFVEAAIRDVMARMNGRHNLVSLERAMELHRTGSAGTKSRAEDAFLRLDLPETLVNMHLLGREVDFHWPDHGVVVEVDGIHGLPWTVADDSGRDAAQIAAGWTVLRFSARDVYERRDAVTVRTAAALAFSPGLRHAA